MALGKRLVPPAGNHRYFSPKDHLILLTFLLCSQFCKRAAVPTTNGFVLILFLIGKVPFWDCILVHPRTLQRSYQIYTEALFKCYLKSSVIKLIKFLQNFCFFIASFIHCHRMKSPFCLLRIHQGQKYFFYCNLIDCNVTQSRQLIW